MTVGSKTFDRYGACDDDDEPSTVDKDRPLPISWCQLTADVASSKDGSPESWCSTA